MCSRDYLVKQEQFVQFHTQGHMFSRNLHLEGSDWEVWRGKGLAYHCMAHQYHSIDENPIPWPG